MTWNFETPNVFSNDAARHAGLLAALRADAPAAEVPMDSEEFAAFYARSARPLWAYLARVSADFALADDLMQESFVKFLCAAPAELSMAEGEVASRRYLFRIATNLLRDHWRRPASTSLEELPEELFAAQDSSRHSDTQVMLGPALTQMRPRDRQLLWLAYAEGYSHREIAQITGLGGASIRLLLFRARRRIARILGAPDSQHAATETAHEATRQLAAEPHPSASATFRSQP